MHVVYQIRYGETSEKQIRHKHKGYVSLSLATVFNTHNFTSKKNEKIQELSTAFILYTQRNILMSLLHAQYGKPNDMPSLTNHSIFKEQAIPLLLQNSKRNKSNVRDYGKEHKMLIYSHDIKPDMHQLYSLPAL